MLTINWKCLSFTLLLTFGQIALADVEQTNSTDTSSGNAPSAPLKITVQKVKLDLEELRDIGLDLKHTLTNCRHLYDEVTLQPVSLQTEPEMIANGVLISIPIGVQSVGPPAPPRKNRVDLLMSEIRPVIALLKKNVDDFVSGNKEIDISDAMKKQLDPQLTQWISLVNDLNAHLTKLDSLTQGPPYSNYDIAAEASAIEQGVKQLDRTRKTTYKIMRREGRSLDH
jgi:biotin operon repressor